MGKKGWFAGMAEDILGKLLPGKVQGFERMTSDRAV
jgi:hypothetical protein